MWARIIEFMLACWLSISPFTFGYPDNALFFWVNDLVCSSLIAFFALICYYEKLSKMHLCNLALSAYLIALSYFFKGSSLEAPLQNYMVLGLLIMMISVIPSEANKPPKPWRNWYDKS